MQLFIHGRKIQFLFVMEEWSKMEYNTLTEKESIFLDVSDFMICPGNNFLHLA